VRVLRDESSVWDPSGRKAEAAIIMEYQGNMIELEQEFIQRFAGRDYVVRDVFRGENQFSIRGFSNGVGYNIEVTSLAERDDRNLKVVAKYRISF